MAFNLKGLSKKSIRVLFLGLFLTQYLFAGDSALPPKQEGVVNPTSPKVEAPPVTGSTGQSASDSQKPVVPAPLNSDEKALLQKLNIQEESFSRNECFDISGKPFRRYLGFGVKKDDNKYYGILGEDLKSIEVTLGDLVTLSNGNVDTQKTISNFKSKKGILDQCNNESLASADSGTGKSSGGSSSGNKSKKGKANCQTPGLAESYVLALSWQPAFCESKGGKPECKNPEFIQDNVFHAKNFTLHGLWPNKSSCGIEYGFCGTEKSNKKNFNSYPPVELDGITSEKMKTHVPSFAAGSGLHLHEWHKHGTCQDLAPSDYFSYAMDLQDQFNSLPKFMKLVRDSIGLSISKLSLVDALTADLGKTTFESLKITCKSGLLSEISIPLRTVSKTPLKIGVGLPKKPDLLHTIDTDSKGRVDCPESITIDRIGPS